MAFIQNIALVDVARGHHRDVEGNGILIQIIDTDWENFPVPQEDFLEVHQFRFLDVEEEFPVADEAMRVTDEQATQIAAILTDALTNGRNVIVHCHAGICRSGAVVEAGVRLGFEDAKRYRAPNRTVLRKLVAAMPEIEFKPFQEQSTGSTFI